MREERSLPSLQKGQRGRVAGISDRTEPSLRRRLMELGLVEGTWVTCVGKSPAGDPVAYRIRGAVIALRGTDAAGVELDRIESELPVYSAVPVRVQPWA